MKRSFLLVIAMTAIVSVVVEDAIARGPRGGGGGGSRGGASRGGGASRPSPSVSRPSPSVSRPSSPSAGTRPSAGSRPSSPSAGARPSTPSAGTRPNLPSAGTRPSTPGAGTRPNLPSTGSRPSTPGAGTRPGTPGAGSRPSQGDLKNFLDLPSDGKGKPGTPSTRPAPGGGAASDFLNNRPAAGELPSSGDRPNAGDRQGNRQGRRNNVSDNRQDRRDNVSDNRNDRTDLRQDRRDQFSDNRGGRIDNRQQWQQNRSTRRDYVNDYMKRYPLRGEFWLKHPNWGRWAINRPYRWATWAAITSWFPWGWSQPTSFSYGENVYYQDNSVYYGDQVVASADEYAEQAYAITESAPEPTDADEWMSLGVFAITQDGEAKGPPPTMFFQLVVSKSGLIAGTFFDQTNEQSMEVEGAVDKESQRTAWVAQGQQWPIVETGISNLTEDASPALVHFEDGQTQQVLLVRLEEQQGSAN